MVKGNKICVNSNLFFGGISSFILVIIAVVVLIISGLIYYIPKLNEKQNIFNQQLLSEAKKQTPQQVIITKQREDKLYPTSQYISREASFDNFQNIGYIYNDSGRFPLYMNRLNNRYYYYTRDDSRNNIKITIGDAERGLKDEFFDGDTVNVSELSPNPFNIKIYENSSTVYNPFGINVY